MTENEAIKELLYQEDMRGKGIDYQANNLVIATAVKALKEIQQYRAIGTVEQLKDMKQNYAEALSDWRQYRKIGTVEECREARERRRAKKPNIITGKTEKDKLACCPICESNLDWTYDGFWRKGNPKYCFNCGQAIDWSDTN